MAAIVEAADDPVISVSLDGVIRTWNPGAERLYGYPAADAVGRRISMLEGPERSGEFESVLSRVAREEQVDRFETVRRRSDGASVDVSLTVSPIRNEDGEVAGVASLGRDITDRKEAEARFESLLEAAPDAMVVVDSAGRIKLANRQVEELFGYSRKDLIGEAIEILIPEALRSTHRGHRVKFEDDPHTRPMGAELDLAGRRRDGSEFPVEISLSPLRTREGLLVTAAVRDVTERRRIERLRAESEERFRRSFEDSGIGMALVAVADGRLERMLEVNESLASITGYSEVQLRAMGALTIVHPDELATLTDDLKALLAGDLPVLRAELRLIDAGGELIWAALTASIVRSPDGEPLHAVFQVQDVSERKRFEGQLQYLADHDALTGLFNRGRFEQELTREVAAAKRYRADGAVIVLDLDHFKSVNDSLGHAAGDELVTIVAEILRRRLRESDVIGRMGGDEFGVILPHANEAQARALAEALLDEIRKDARASTASGTRRVTASAGVAIFGEGLEELEPEELLAEADIAMYDAKGAGRDRVEVYDAAASRHERMETRLAWSGRIEAAIEGGDFALHAQPILSLNGTTEGRHELLVRMVAEDGDLIPPGAFLYIAERSDLVQEIDRWVVRSAVELLAEQHRHGRDVSFEVNLSAKSINDERMPDFIAATVKASGVNPTRIIFEVTETAAIVNVNRAQEFARRLREVGCRFALDDFGAGFASFYYLKHLPFDYLKIDGEFIQDLTANRTNQLVVGSLVDIARGLGKRTIAEFVGDQATIDLLRDYGVDYAQGFYVGRPVPVGDADFAHAPAEPQLN